MFNFEPSLDQLLNDAAEHLDADRRSEAREALRQALELDRNNLRTWELLWRAANNREEEIISLKRMLRIDPRHAAAKRRLAELQPAGSSSQPLSRKTSPRTATRQNRQQAGTLLLVFMGGLLAVLCLSV